MTELRIPMDPWNPGQFYACCGLVELFGLRAEQEVLSRFIVDERRPRHGFFMLSSQAELDLSAMIGDLLAAEYGFVDEVEKAIRPVVVRLRGTKLELDWWLDPFREKAGHFKGWAGKVTIAKLIKDLTHGWKFASPETLFQQSRMMKSKFGIDPRSAWTALGVGYSPDKHKQDAATFPAVELLGAIGLQGFRPTLQTRDCVSYALWRTALPKVPARRAAGTPWDGLAVSRYEFEIAKRGQGYKYFTFAKQKE